jgi:formylglycine-generating enzyme required for sulfatase activity
VGILVRPLNERAECPFHNKIRRFFFWKSLKVSFNKFLVYNGSKGKKVSKVNMPNKGEINKQRAQCLVEALLRLVDTNLKAVQVTWNFPDTLRVSGANDERGTTSKDLLELVQQLDSNLFSQVEHVRDAIHVLKGFGLLEDLRSANNSPYWKFNLKFNNGSGQNKTLEENLEDLENQLNESTKSDNQVNIKRYRQTGIHFIENLGNGVELEMVLIKGGIFTMGAPETEEGSRDEERPQHEVTLETFFMGKYPITQAQWKAVAALPKVNRNLAENPFPFKDDDQPIENVSWYDAVEFCDRLTKHTTRKYSLPSEAQWEYACRAGTTTPFHFGETITSELANYAEGTYGNAPKGKYRRQMLLGSFDAANDFGLYDMHGNVWEMCLDDWHDNYKEAPTDGSAWLDDIDNDTVSLVGKCSVVRGGSWNENPASCRSACRINNEAVRVYFYKTIGFRVVCGVGRVLQ